MEKVFDKPGVLAHLAASLMFLYHNLDGKGNDNCLNQFKSFTVTLADGNTRNKVMTVYNRGYTGLFI